MSKVTKEHIVSTTEEIIEEYIDAKNWESRPEMVVLNLQDIYETVIYPRYEIEVNNDVDIGYDENGEKILGKKVKGEKLILIDRSLSYPIQDPRYIFTFGHEFGHAIFHPEGEDPHYCSPAEISIFIKEKNRKKQITFSPQEVQANFFAENLLMPTKLVLFRVFQCYNPKDSFAYKGPGKYWFQVFKAEIYRYISSLKELCRTLAHYIRKYFCHVSKEALGYKIWKMGLINNQTNENFFEERTHLAHQLKQIV